MKSNIGKVFYAVTDQFVIIPIKVVKEDVEEDSSSYCKTEVEGESGFHQECHHRHYFKSIWVESGEADNPCVFSSEKGAVKNAIEKIERSIKVKKADILSLKAKKDSLKLAL